LLDLVPAAGSAPNFRTPADAGMDIDQGIDVLAHTSRARVRTEMRSICREWTDSKGAEL